MYHYNKAIKSSIKTRIKNLLVVLETKNNEDAHSQLKKVISSISRAVSKGIIHKKTASRRISRLTKMVNRLLAA
ncbi:MAG: 30S ribosomal protein S20 [Deltaproteobacteria bacterium]|nr:30S ribosomal protein S20 [Deltaproteobacteria bacterium]